MSLSDYFPETTIVLEKGKKPYDRVTPAKKSVGNDIRNLVQSILTARASDNPPSQPVQDPEQVVRGTVATPVATPQGSIPGFKTWNPPQDLSNLIVTNAQKYGVHPAVLAAVLQNESGINPNVNDNNSVMENGKTSRDRGIAQISDYWNPTITDAQARDPAFAIEYAAKTLSENNKVRNNWRQAVAGYNVGLSRTGGGAEMGRNERGLGPKGEDYSRKAFMNIDPETLKQLGLE